MPHVVCGGKLPKKGLAGESVKLENGVFFQAFFAPTYLYFRYWHKNAPDTSQSLRSWKMISRLRFLSHVMWLLLLISTASPNTNWVFSKPFHEGKNIAYANGLFILRSNSLGAGYQSKDGLIWKTFRDTGVAAHHSAERVVFLDGRFHAFSSPGGNAAYSTSFDGMHWTDQPLPIPCSFADMAWGKDLFVGVSSCFDSLSATSPDGINWTRRNIGNAYLWDRICYGSGIFVAMNSRGAISVSSDGSTWQSVNEVYRSDDIRRNREMVYGNGMFVIVGNRGRILTSTGGMAWKESTPLDMAGDYYSMVFEAGQFVVIDNHGGAFRSRDGLVWKETPGNPSGIPSLTYGNGRYLAVSENGTAYSDDSAATWKVSKAREKLFIYDAAYSGKDFIVVGNSGAIATSPDGLDWTERDAETTSDLLGVVWGNDRALAYGSGGTTLTSTDLAKWNTLIDPRRQFGSMVFGGSVFVGLTIDGKIFASSDGLAWDSAYAVSTGQYLGHLAYGNGIFLVGDATNPGTLLKSTDGRLWTRIQNDAVRKTLRGLIVYGKDSFLISEGGAAKDTLYRTTDGTDVRPVKVSVPAGITYPPFANSMQYGQGYYMATETIGMEGVVAYSADGIEWRIDQSDLLIAHEIIFGGGTMLCLTNADNMVTMATRFDPVTTNIYPLRRRNSHRHLGNRVNKFLDVTGRMRDRNGKPAHGILITPN